MRSLRPLAASSLSNFPDNPTPLPDERDGPSSGLSSAPSGQQLEPDDNKPRYLCRILRLSSGLSGFVEAWEPPTGSEGVHAAQGVFLHHALCCSTSCGKGGPVPLRSFVSGFISLRRTGSCLSSRRRDAW